jgi:hypothetical protein
MPAKFADAFRALSIFVVTALALCVVFWLFRPEYRHAAPIQATGSEATLVVEGAKEFSSTVAMLTTLTTGLFVLVALVVRNPLRPSVAVSIGQMLLLGIFGVCATGSFYAALQAKYAIADGILAKSLDLALIGQQLGIQAWFVAFAGAGAVSLVVDALMTVKA